MNIVPMFLNIFVPWSIFTFLCGLCASWLMYAQPGFVWVIIAVVFVGWLWSFYKALHARKNDPEPTWYSYVSLSVGLAMFAGVICGLITFETLTKPYFALRDLKTIKNLDVSKELGQNVMDAGIVHFAKGTALDGLKSWHFKNGELYCVAPIVMNDAKPQSQSYDFWAVGKECCSASTSDFRCGAWAIADAAGALRVTDDKDVPFYRLAVKQAETLYGIVATHPIFLKWSVDPMMEVNTYNTLAYKNYLFMVACAFVFSLFFVSMASCKYAWIGRGTKMEMYDDPTWNTAGYSNSRTSGPASLGYNAI